ncbi:IS4 family transposase [Anatilimnocola sp. NA78]|uniref:IS4 family transposase n=1 Tax=Anatilimnocola sp. NA78 TaxID=3415683 RepID=UPI003CE5174D
MSVELDVEAWAEQQFGRCDLGDARRTRRIVRTAALCAADPSGTTPEQTETWEDCKAAYRLFDTKAVTFAGIAGPHWEQTRARTSGHYLLIGDTTLISFEGDRQISGMGIITSGNAQGFLLHSALMVDARDGEVIGLAGQTIRYRQRVPKKEPGSVRLQRDRESEIWGKVITAVGAPSNEQVRFTHVCDRGADNFEVYCHCLLQGADWVIRAKSLTRKIYVAGQLLPLADHLLTLPLAGTYPLEIKANANQVARTATVEVRCGLIGMPEPHQPGRFTQECGITFLTMNVIEVKEVDPPRGQKPLQWVLYTSHAVTCWEDALTVIEYYERRPLVEEFHKALKTGCRIEERLYETAPRWENVTALLSIIAVRLLQLKTIALKEPNRPAAALVPAIWLRMLTAVRGRKRQPIVTAHDFLRALAGLGGHLGRKHDGEPGWLTIWRGFDKLQLLLRGATNMQRNCG